jgi:hypothetical protein
MQRKVMQSTLAMLSLSFFAVVVAIGLIGSPEAEALPSNDVTRVYYHDAEHTQYAGEEWIMSCSGAVGMMVDGVRAKYHISISETCVDPMRQTYKCYVCNVVNGYPMNPMCNSQPPAGQIRYCPPRGF